LAEVGVPAGVVNVVTTTDAPSVSAAIIADPRLRKLSFTGSTAVGKRLIAQSAQNVLRTSMELGGNAPFLVFEDADVDAAVDGAMQAKFRNIGQACTAANRLLVHRSVVEEFTSKVTRRVSDLVVGDGLADGVTIGPLIDERARTGVHRLVADALDRGARLVVGGGPLPGPGHFYAPTVVSDVSPGSDLLREEIFGPVLAVVPFDTEDEAVAAANDTEYGLVSYAYTRDLSRGHRVIERLKTGMTGLNVGVVSDAAAPFGGVKQSGVGREGGLEGIHEYLSAKYTLIPR
jgi:succinate-semialdehyde dehydrogenase / glutarate-semialdehyde dehydrogenase